MGRAVVVNEEQDESKKALGEYDMIDRVAGTLQQHRSMFNVDLHEPASQLLVQESIRDLQRTLLEDDDQQEDEEETKISLKRFLRPVHIKRARRQYFQLFKNMFIFYDAAIEKRLPPGETMLGYVKRLLETQVFNFVRRPKALKKFVEAVNSIESLTSQKLVHYDMKETEFVKFFASEHVTGLCQVLMKKMLWKQITTDFNYVPVDQLHCIPERVLRQDF